MKRIISIILSILIIFNMFLPSVTLADDIADASSYTYIERESEGEEAVLTSSDTYARCIYVAGGSLTIDGDFTMSGDNVLNSVYAAHDIIISGGSIKAIGSVYGIRAERKLYIRDTITRVEADGKGNGHALCYSDIEVGNAVLVTDYRLVGENNQFGGWYSDETLTQKYNFDTELLIEQRIYAK